MGAQGRAGVGATPTSAPQRRAGPGNTGVTGTLGGYKSLAQLAAALQAMLLPSSLVRPPNALGNNGGRTTLQTALTLAGSGAAVSGSINAVPAFTANGSVFTGKMFQQSVTATSTTTTILFGFSFSSTAYTAIIQNITTGGNPTSPTTRSTSGLTFTSINGDIYAVFVMGT